MATTTKTADRSEIIGMIFIFNVYEICKMTDFWLWYTVNDGEKELLREIRSNSFFFSFQSNLFSHIFVIFSSDNEWPLTPLLPVPYLL